MLPRAHSTETKTHVKSIKKRIGSEEGEEEKERRWLIIDRYGLLLVMKPSPVASETRNRTLLLDPQTCSAICSYYRLFQQRSAAIKLVVKRRPVSARLHYRFRREIL